RLLDFFAGALRDPVHRDVHRHPDLAVAEDLDAVPLALRETLRAHRGHVDRRARLEPVEVFDANFGPVHREWVLETPLRESTLERHLPAFEPASHLTRLSRGLALAA